MRPNRPVRSYQSHDQPAPRQSRELPGRAGFASTRSWIDANNRFALGHARP